MMPLQLMAEQQARDDARRAINDLIKQRKYNNYAFERIMKKYSIPSYDWHKYRPDEEDYEDEDDYYAQS